MKKVFGLQGKWMTLILIVCMLFTVAESSYAQWTPAGTTENQQANPIYVHSFNGQPSSSAIYIGHGNEAIVLGQQTGPYNLAIGNIGIGGVLPLGQNKTRHNTAIGNAVLGVYKGSFSTNLGYNTGIGYGAMQSLDSGGSNTAVGYSAMGYHKFSQGNSAFGDGALLGPAGGVNGDYNTAIGVSSMRNYAGGGSNTAVGVSSLQNYATGNGGNTAIGTSSMLYFTGGLGVNTAVGNSALRGSASGATGSSNSAFGNGALLAITTGTHNVGVGASALSGLQGGTHNVAIGPSALGGVSSGTHNVGIGATAFVPNGAASYQLSIQNTIWGVNMEGQANPSIGIAAVPVSIGSGNYAKLYIGGTNTITEPSLQLKSVQNTPNVGSLYLYVDPTTGVVKQGTPNGTGTGITNACANINYVPKTVNSGGNLGCSQIFDNGASVGIATATPRTFTGVGVVIQGSPVNPTVSKLDVNGLTFTNTLVVSSDKRLKKNIQPIKEAMNKIIHLKGVQYDWKKEEFNKRNLDNTPQIGFLAQEVAEVLPEAVMIDNEGFYALNYNMITPVLTEGIKEQQSQIENLKLENENFKLQLTELRNKLNQLAPGDVKINVNSLEIVPNPITGTSTVSYKLNNGSAASFLIIADLQGKLLKQISLPKNTKEGQVQVSKKDLPNGLYIFSLLSGNTEIQSKKVLVAE